MIKKIKSLKIRTQFALVLLCTGILCLFLFEKLWANKWTIGRFFTGIDYSLSQMNDMDFMDDFYEAARHYDIPDSEDDTEAVEALAPFLDMTDKYTSAYIYGLDDGYYRAGKYAQIMDAPFFRTFFDLGYGILNGDGESLNMIPMKFRNGTALVMLYNYQSSVFIYPYFAGCFLFCCLLFFIIVLFFINRKMHSVTILEQEILTMASGDLTHEVPDFGQDEIGILGKELNGLRNSLNDMIFKEQESRRANQDLITALSHDLRTPLTILTGYLEVLRLKRDPEAEEEYLEKCLKKTEDIKELTDKMFEYALVSEENEAPEMAWISTDFIEQCLLENCDFIKLAGFTFKLHMPSFTGVLEMDKTMLKRIFNNLFSNILKYGDKNQPVTAEGRVDKNGLIISISNTVKQEHSQTNSNNIGLKNVQTMMQLLNGSMTADTQENIFKAELRFPLR